MLALTEHYPAIKTLHQGAVGLSLSLFAVRWLGVLAAAPWPMRARLRWASVGIDVVLLCAGLTLWWAGGWTLAQAPWLAAKLLLLPVYVVLGSWALKRAQTWRGHLLFGLAALGVVAWMAGMALAHHPAGWFSSAA